MAVLGAFCRYGKNKKRISYAVLDGAKNNPQKKEVDTQDLSQDKAINPVTHIYEVGKLIYDLCKIHSIQKMCLFAPEWGGGRNPNWKIPDLMKYRMEGAIVDASLQYDILTFAKNTREIASDLEVGREGGQRERFQNKMEEMLSLANADQRDAAAAAISILE